MAPWHLTKTNNTLMPHSCLHPVITCKQKHSRLLLRSVNYTTLELCPFDQMILRHDIQLNATLHNDFQPTDIQHTDIQHDDIRHNDIQHYGRPFLCLVSFNTDCHMCWMSNVMCHYAECSYAQCFYDECRGAEFATSVLLPRAFLKHFIHFPLFSFFVEHF